MIMDKEKLKNDYENACNAYLKAFCEKHDYIYEGLDMWVGNDVGTVACCGDGYHKNRHRRGGTRG